MGSAGGAPRIETLFGVGDVALVGAGDVNATNVLRWWYTPAIMIFTPRAHARARGYVIGRGVYILLYIVYKSALFFGTNLISPKILTFRGLF